MLGRISVMAVPSILQQSFVSVGNIFIQTLVNGYGSAAVAGYSAAVKLNTFAITSFTTLSSSMSNFTSQNIGAGELKRVRQGFRTGMIMIMCVALPFVIAFVFFGEPMIRLFVDSPTQTAIDTGTTFLVIVAPFYFMAAAKQIADGILRGAGRRTGICDVHVFRSAAESSTGHCILKAAGHGKYGHLVGVACGMDDIRSVLDAALDCHVGVARKKNRWQMCGE